MGDANRMVGASRSSLGWCPCVLYLRMAYDVARRNKAECLHAARDLVKRRGEKQRCMRPLVCLCVLRESQVLAWGVSTGSDRMARRSEM